MFAITAEIWKRTVKYFKHHLRVDFIDEKLKTLIELKIFLFILFGLRLSIKLIKLVSLRSKINKKIWLQKE